jgi:hypothetical protein
LWGALQAHIAEHLGYQYRRQVQEAIGTHLPGPEEKSQRPWRCRFPRWWLKGSQIVLAQSLQAKAQQQALQNAQDPIMMAEMQKLQIQQAEVQRKAQKDQADTQIKMLQLQLDQLKPNNRQSLTERVWGLKSKHLKVSWT